MPNTTNFNWPTPADTDLVKDGAAAIRNLGNGVDTSLVDLKGGTTGQILSKASNADMDFAFITPNVGDLTEVQAGVGISVASGTGPIPIITNSSTDLITTAGDLLYGTAADTVARLGIGTAGQVLKVNSGATAPEWGAAASGLTLITRNSYSNVASHIVDGCFTSTYKSYLLVIEVNSAATVADDLQFQWRVSGSTHATNYYGIARQIDYVGTATSTLTSNTTQLTLHPTSTVCFNFTVNRVGSGSQSPTIYGIGSDYDNAVVISTEGIALASIVATGFLLKSSNTNITGTTAVYGLAI